MSQFVEPCWSVAEDLIVSQSIKTIQEFSESHIDEACSFFAICVDHCFGDVLICIDTLDNSLLNAKRQEARTLRARTSALATGDGWENAPYIIKRSTLAHYNQDTSSFTYPELSRIQLPDWEKYFATEVHPDGPDPIGHVIVLLHNALQRISTDKCFDRLAISSPFYVGIELPTSKFGLIVIKILNWPAHAGPRA